MDNRETLISQFLKENKGMSDANITYFLREYALLSEAEKSEAGQGRAGEVCNRDPL